MQSKRRPASNELEAELRATEGNITMLAARLGVSKPTVYKWLEQAGLQRLAGIGREVNAHRPAPGRPESRLESTLRINTSVRIREGLWTWLRMHSIETGRNATDLLEGIIADYRDRTEVARARKAGV